MAADLLVGTQSVLLDRVSTMKAGPDFVVVVIEVELFSLQMNFKWNFLWPCNQEVKGDRNAPVPVSVGLAVIYLQRGCVITESPCS